MMRKHEKLGFKSKLLMRPTVLLAAGNLLKRTQFYCNVNVVHEVGGGTGWSEIWSPTDELDCVTHIRRASRELSRANVVALPGYCCSNKKLQL